MGSLSNTRGTFLLVPSNNSGPHTGEFWIAIHLEAGLHDIGGMAFIDILMICSLVWKRRGIEGEGMNIIMLVH